MSSPASQPPSDRPARRSSRRLARGGWSWVVAVGALVAVAAFATSLDDAGRFAGIDLRCKVTAARAMLAGLDPYSFSWQPGMPEELLDPQQRQPGPSRATYPPTLLGLYSPLCSLPYRTQRYAWVLLEWAALAGTIASLAGRQRSARARALVVGGALLLVAGSRFFRLHVERGQYYVFVALLFALAAWLEKRRPGSYLVGIPLGLAAALRPSYVLLSPLLWLARRRPAALAAATTFAIAVLATLPLAGVRGWQSYVENVRTFEHAKFDPAWLDVRFGPPLPVPAIAEGIDFRGVLPHHSADVTLSQLVRVVTGSSSTPIDPRPLNLVCVVLAVGAAAWMAHRAGRLGPRSSLGLLVCIVGVLDLDLLAPQRFGYADVLLVVPLGMLAPMFVAGRGRGLLAAAVVSAFLLGDRIGWPLDGAAPTVYRTLVVLGAITAVTVLRVTRPGSNGRAFECRGSFTRPTG